jgi:S1-C subfamily serine protease
MSIQVQQGHGISLQLASVSPTLQTGRVIGGYYKVRLDQAGSGFFDLEIAQLIQQYLGEFLPRAVEQTTSDGKPGIFYQSLHQGVELCGQSSQLKPGDKLPQDELDRLNLAVANLKNRERDPQTDPMKRKAIQAFRLPGVDKDPELYRVCQIGGKKKLLVLWGIEKEPGSSVVPEQAVSQIVAVATKPAARRSPLVWLVPLLAAVAVAGSVLSFRGCSSSPAHPGGDSLISGKTEPTNPTGPTSALDPGSPQDSESPPATPQEKSSAEAKPGQEPASNPPSDAANTGSPPEPIVARPDLTGPDPAAAPGTALNSPGGPGDPALDSTPGGPVLPGNDPGPPPVVGEEIAATPAGSPDALVSDSPTPGAPTPDSPVSDALAPGTDTAGLDTNPEAAALSVISGPTKLPIDDQPSVTEPRPPVKDEADLAKLTRPAVVTIAAGTKKTGYTGQGTGFLIASDGVLVTSAHVINGMDRIVAITATGHPLTVTKVIATDKIRDLAILKLDTEGKTLPFLRLGESESAKVGGKVAVMGTPKGLSSTFTVGIVSALRAEQAVRMVQITAPVSPGSSGSPVVGDDALVIGIVKGGIDMSVAQALNFAVDVGELHELLSASDTGSAKAGFSQVGKGEASNTKNPDTLPASAAIAQPPTAAVAWEIRSFQPASPSLSPSPSPSPVVPPPVPIPDEIPSTSGPFSVTGISRKVVDDQHVELQLKVAATNPGGTLGPVRNLKCSVSNKPLKVTGDQVTLVAEKGLQLMLVEGLAADGKVISATVELNVLLEVNTGLDIRIK